MALFGLFGRSGRVRTLEVLPVSRIIANQNGLRKVVDEEGISELAESIANSGLLRPLAVHKKGLKYELVSGERRLRAVKKLGHKRVLCIVDRSGGDDLALTAMIESLQSEAPDAFVQAECCLKLMNRLKMSEEQLAGRMGKSRRFVADKLCLLNIEPSVRDGIRRYALSERHARAALMLDETEQRLELVRIAGEGRLDAEQTEALAERMTAGERPYDADGSGTKPESETKPEIVPEIKPETKPRRVVVRLVKDYRVFLNTVNTACEQLRSGGIKVDVDKSDREDGLDIVIRVTRERAKRAIGKN